MTSARSIQNPGRRDLIAAALAAGALSYPIRALAAAYPARTITLVSPFVAGGPNDIVGRIIAESLKDALKQPVLVDNVTGAGGLVGTRKVLVGPSDGYTLLIGAAYLVTAPHLYKAATFDPAQDLIPLSPPIESSLVFVSAEHTDLKSLIESAKKSGKPIRLASPGAGTLSHLGGEMLRLAANAPLVHIPYRGIGPAMTDVMGGHADLLIDGVSSSLPQIRDGRLRALAVPDEQRNSLLPDAPTTAQLGWPSVKVRAWNAIFAKAGTPADIVELLTTEITKVVNRPEITSELKKRGLDPSPLAAAAFKQRLAVETAHWKSVVQSAKITLE
ncbi:Bug family tripartite tricarboxylate transporter substrate binding protein [Ottowia thiooxydans]|uniref:Bug family tripartite tricarboxylate transporter substrate binding protein n=1 Tax=Ottowia thiooxydans TaxID=219182 RepID=UPI0004039BC5|nr:tripartite tricarboxylate transporter substrate binding protein [Ottowia thiooxydans]